MTLYLTSLFPTRLPNSPLLLFASFRSCLGEYSDAELHHHLAVRRLLVRGGGGGGLGCTAIPSRGPVTDDVFPC